MASHAEMAKGLDVSGTYIKYFGSKRDGVVVQGQLFNARLRWKRLTVRTHEKRRHLQQAYRKSKQVYMLPYRRSVATCISDEGVTYLAKGIIKLKHIARKECELFCNLLSNSFNAFLLGNYFCRKE